jgi:serine/threonine protein phosphatase PrpC
LYPTPSGAYELAKLFCHTIIENAENMYEQFSEEKLIELFKIGNEVAKKFNESSGRNKESIDYREFDLFAATTAFVIIKESRVYWWSLGDSGITAFDENKSNIFQSPEAWPDEKEKISATGNTPLTDTEFNKLKKRLFRNALTEEGERFGYGVITGEDSACVYLNTGSFTLKKGFLILIYTDGYENYIPLSEFVKTFNNWTDDIDTRFDDFILQKSREDSNLYGREKTIVAVEV